MIELSDKCVASDDYNDLINDNNAPGGDANVDINGPIDDIPLLEPITQEKKEEVEIHHHKKPKKANVKDIDPQGKSYQDLFF